MDEPGELSFNFTAILNTQPEETGLASYIRQFFHRQDIITPRRSLTEPDESISQLDFSGYLGAVEGELRTIRSRSSRRIELNEAVAEEQM